MWTWIVHWDVYTTRERFIRRHRAENSPNLLTALENLQDARIFESVL
jgi:hypothetical protein